MGVIFSKDSTTYAGFGKRIDADGKVWVQAIAHGALTAKTPYKVIVNEYGNVTAALADDTTYIYVGVPAEAASAGDLVWMQIGGPCLSMVTGSLSISVGHAVSMDGGAVADAGADYTGAAGEFGVCMTASTAATTQDVMLVPERVLTTT